jgi:hypothetical protein
MILNSNISQTSIQAFKDENFELNKENDDELFFNAFNMQSSEFFNKHHLSSKSNDYEKYTKNKKDYDINYDYLLNNSQNNLKVIKNENENNLNHSFDFSLQKKNLIIKEKIGINDSFSYLKNKNRANSAKMTHKNKYLILKEELKLFNNGNGYILNFNYKNNNSNNIFICYANNQKDLNNGDNQREKYILDIVDDESDCDYKEEINNSNEDKDFDEGKNLFFNNENNKNYDDNEEENVYFSNKNNFKLNYLNKNFNLSNNNILHQNINSSNNVNYYNNNNNLNILEDNNNLIDYNEIKILNNINPIKQNLEEEKINLEIILHAPSFIRDQTGCRLIQKKIDENPKISDDIFNSLYYELMSMSTDLFGNYVIQKLLDNISIENLEKFIDLISIKFNYIATSTYGTRVIQKLLEILSKENENKESREIYDNLFYSLNKMIIKNIVQLSSDSNSSHIIIKYVNVIKYPKNCEMFDSVFNNFIPLCKDKHGCCVIRKCIEAGINEQKEKLFSLSNKYCSQLISDQFGNYVIQYVVGLNNENINKNIVKVIMNDLIKLCKEKYASNVIEKFLFFKSLESKEVIKSIINEEKNLHELIIDQYGNYIIQRILSIVSPEIRLNLMSFIASWYDEIKNLSFGNRLITKLNERYTEFTSLIQNIYGINKNNINVNNKFKNNNSIGNKNLIQMNHYNNYIGINNNFYNNLYKSNIYKNNNPRINNQEKFGDNNSSFNYNFQQFQYQYLMMNYLYNLNNTYNSNKNNFN